MIDELRTPDMLKKLGEWRSGGLSWRKIRELVKEEIGKDVTEATLKKTFQLVESKTSEIIAGDEELKGKLSNVVFNQASRLKHISDMCDKLLNELMDSREDPTAAIAAMREVREQIKLQKELLDRMTEGFDQNKINRIQYTNISVNNLNELEKSGYIKILRKPGETYDPEKKDLELIKIDKEELNKLESEGMLKKEGYCIQVE